MTDGSQSGNEVVIANVGHQYRGDYMTLNQNEFSKLSKIAKQNQKLIKRSERLEVGSGSRGLGSLRAYFLPSGAIHFYYGHKNKLGKQDDYPIGVFASSRLEANSAGGNCMTLAMARKSAFEAAKVHSDALKGGFDGIRHYRKELAINEARMHQLSEIDVSLKALMQLYIDIKYAEGKVGYSYDVLNICKNHLFSCELADVDAKKVSKKDFAAVLRRVKEAGKKRTYQKLRSYLMAAYNMALDAEYDESCDSRFIPFEITAIPIAKTKDRGALAINKRQRFLSIEEIESLWQWLEGHPCYQSDFLKLKLLTGQRTVQMLRVKTFEVDPVNRTMTIWDGKGMRIKPRRHQVPLADEAWNLISKGRDLAMSINSEAIFLNTGMNQAKSDSLIRFCAKASLELLERKEIREKFVLSDLRRTFETHTARLKVSKDVRAQLASHGISGVQDNHYNMYDYEDDKREAFALWERELKKIVRGGYENVVLANFR